MNLKVLPLMLSAAAALGVAAFLCACELETMAASEYCAQIPSKICDRLFDEACALVPASSAPRYASADMCEAAEKVACEARAADARLTFDGEAASLCVTDLNAADCEKAARMQVHSCDKVFTEGDAGVAPIEALDSGTPDAATASDGNNPNGNADAPLGPAGQSGELPSVRRDLAGGGGRDL